MQANICMLSGGLDSTYATWKAAQQSGRLIIVHLVFINSYYKQIAEYQAVQNILMWLKLNGYEYTFWDVDINTLKLTNHGYDEDWVFFMAALACRNVPECVVSIYEGTMMEDNDGETLRKRWSNRGDVYEYFHRMQWYTEKYCDLILPAREKTKQQIWDELPEDLRNLTFSCSRPIYNKPCGECKKCLEIKGLKENDNGPTE